MSEKTRDRTIRLLLERKIIAVVRENSEADAEFVVDSLLEAGVDIVEITLTTPGAISQIRRLVQIRNIVVGAGTLIDRKVAESLFEVGIGFYASPILDAQTVALAKQAGVAAIPGALTPS